MNVKEKVQEILLSHIPCLTVEEITPEAELVKDLGADSLAMLEMLFDLEEISKKNISDETALKFQTVRDVEEFLEKEGPSDAL
jgi:acyl carrier protein